MADRERLNLLERIRERTGANLAQCAEALKASNSNPRAALNLLAAQGHRGRRLPYEESIALGSYAFDTYGRRLVEECSSTLASYLRKGDAPLSGVVLHAQQGLPVRLVTAYVGDLNIAGKPQVLLDVTSNGGAIPSAPGEEDRLLETFRYRFGFQETRPDVGLFDEEPALGWEESTLPACLYFYEIIQTAHAIAKSLAQGGYRASPKFVGAYARHDFLAGSSGNQLETVRNELRKHMATKEVLRAFAKLCYATSEKQQWLAQVASSG